MQKKKPNESFRKYTYRVEWSEEDHAHIAHCLEFPSLMAHGETPEQALSEIEQVVRVTLEWLSESGEPIPDPYGMKRYRGNITLRIPSELHRKLSILSAEAGVSLNQYILSKIS